MPGGRTALGTSLGAWCAPGPLCTPSSLLGEVAVAPSCAPARRGVVGVTATGGRDGAGLKPAQGSSLLNAVCCRVGAGQPAAWHWAPALPPPPQGSVTSSWDVAVTEQEVTQPGAWWQHVRHALAMEAAVRPPRRPRGDCGDRFPSLGLARPHLFQGRILFALVS